MRLRAALEVIMPRNDAIPPHRNKPHSQQYGSVLQRRRNQLVLFPFFYNMIHAIQLCKPSSARMRAPF